MSPSPPLSIERPSPPPQLVIHYEFPNVTRNFEKLEFLDTAPSRAWLESEQRLLWSQISDLELDGYDDGPAMRRLEKELQDVAGAIWELDKWQSYRNFILLRAATPEPCRDGAFVREVKRQLARFDLRILAGDCH